MPLAFAPQQRSKTGIDLDCTRSSRALRLLDPALHRDLVVVADFDFFDVPRDRDGAGVQIDVDPSERERFAFVETVLGETTSLRRGWGVEATRLALAYAMDTLDPHRVEAKVYAYNVLSINALRRNGFHLEGTLREARIYDGRRWDVLVYSIIESELRAQRTRDNFAPMGLWPAGDASA